MISIGLDSGDTIGVGISKTRKILIQATVPGAQARAVLTLEEAENFADELAVKIKRLQLEG